jgi:hypothetical protein
LEPQVESDPWDAWAAGFFDGEGNVSIVQNSGQKAGKLRITAAQVHKEPLERFQYLFGGALRLARGKNNWSDYWVWDTGSEKAANALKRMLPFLSVTKQQAELGIHFQTLVRTNGPRPKLSELELAERDRIKRALIPQRLAIALQDAGWWVRSIIIWDKSNPMPESRDRPPNHEP